VSRVAYDNGVRTHLSLDKMHRPIMLDASSERSCPFRLLEACITNTSTSDPPGTLQIRSNEVCGKDKCVSALRSVEDREPPRKIAVSFGPAFPPDTLDQDFAARRVRIGEKLKRFGHAVDEWHGIGIGQLVPAT
jgi:hypothetical protein